MSRRPAAAPVQAYVLHRYDWSESSLILELFTRERGRVAVVAKGAKRPYSQLRPVLLPFQRLNALLGRPPGDESAELLTLRSAEWAGGVPTVAGAALFSGFYLNELLLKLLARHDPHAALFDAYAGTLPTLGGDESAASAAALRAFELVLLRETGVLPALDALTHTLLPVRPEAHHTLHAEAGVTERGADTGLPGRMLQELESALAAGDLAALQRACLTAPVALRHQLRALLQYHLGSVNLRTRQLMLDLQRLTPSDRDPR